MRWTPATWPGSAPRWRGRPSPGWPASTASDPATTPNDPGPSGQGRWASERSAELELHGLRELLPGVTDLPSPPDLQALVGRGGQRHRPDDELELAVHRRPEAQGVVRAAQLLQARQRERLARVVRQHYLRAGNVVVAVVGRAVGLVAVYGGPAHRHRPGDHLGWRGAGRGGGWRGRG